ncbi:MAG TPA: hypothetical protein VHZ53_02010 [Steroidobacteraceae bacterium]|jgi:hypothetical protein|nr:hypothetical protein [Steroidobacteraceae bacterium]
MSGGTRILTASSSATAPGGCRGHVLISGSYGGEYNAYHAGKRGLRGVVLNDAGVGRNRAGIRGLDYLDAVGLAAAAADARTCHIGDGEHMLEHGVISHVNRAAARLGCAPGDSVSECAERMRSGAVVDAPMPAIAGGQRHALSARPGEPALICIDAAPMLEATDAGSIAVTGSHAALFRGKPDGVIRVDVRAIFFSDAGIGLDDAGVARLPTLDERGIAAAAAAADSAEIGNARSIHADGIMSRVNATAAELGARPGDSIRGFIETLLTRWRATG